MNQWKSSLRSFLSLVLILGLLMGNTLAAVAQSGGALNMIANGVVYINGSPAPAGTEVRADVTNSVGTVVWSSDELPDPPVTDAAGGYVISIPGAPGNQVKFYVLGLPSEETRLAGKSWRSGGYVLDLNISASLVITPDGATVKAGDTQDYTAVISDGHGNSVDVTASTAFSTDDPKGSFADATYTGGQVGTWTQTGDCSGLADTAGVTVEHGDATSVVLTPDPWTVVAGQTVTYMLMAYDVMDNGWDVTAEGSYAIEAGAGGSWAANVYTAQSAGTWIVTGSLDGLSDDATLTVDHAAATSVVLTPDPGRPLLATPWRTR